MAKAYLTSNSLIKSIRRRVSTPIHQNTFQTGDFLDFANEEIQTGLLPAILTLHEDYYTFTEEVPLVSNQSRYPVPPRAIGQTLRDMFYKDNGGNIRELTRIEEDDRAYYQEGNSNNYVGFYFEGNEIVMSPPVTTGATGSLLFVYHFRPNMLVSEDRAVQIESIDRTARTISVIATGAGSVQITTSAAHELIEGDWVRLSLTTSTPVIDGLYQIVSIVDSTNFTIDATVTVAGSAGSATPGKITCTDALPSNLEMDSLADFIEEANGNRTKGYDATILAASTGSGVIQFDPDQIPSTLIPNDYVCSQQETIIPQIPTDFHTVLAQRVACAMLESMGDQNGLASATAKLQKMEDAMGNVLNVRSLGTPIKINSRRTLIRYSRITFRRGSW